MNEVTFADFQFLPEIQQALNAARYVTPTPIQAQAIPHALAGRDVLGCAQTGTGKTAAFALPILQRLGSSSQRSQPKSPRVLVLSPTRELAAQIGDSFAEYGRNLRLRHTVIFGGVGQGHQTRALQKGVHILIATPGRLLDLMGQGFVRLDNLEVFVLDEADRMLDMGFMPDLKRIIAHLPKERHSLFFSATMPPKVAELAEGLLRNPVRVEVTPESSTVERIDQQVLHMPGSDKSRVLRTLVDGPEVGKVLVFTRTKRRADVVAKNLTIAGVKAEAIHGNKSQSARTKTLDKFRSQHLRVVVATDLASRGIDIDGITHVVNYDLPLEPEAYVHRIGRTGRAGAAGVAWTLCDPAERGLLRNIERAIRQAVPVHAEFVDNGAPATETIGPRGPRPNRPGRGPGRPGGGRPGQGRPGRSRSGQGHTQGQGHSQGERRQGEPGRQERRTGGQDGQAQGQGQRRRQEHASGNAAANGGPGAPSSGQPRKKFKRKPKAKRMAAQPS